MKILEKLNSSNTAQGILNLASILTFMIFNYSYENIFTVISAGGAIVLCGSRLSSAVAIREYHE